MSVDHRPGATRLIDIVFPGDTNHHGTLFGGVGLAHMDKVAFIAAARHARVDFVTASCERIDFVAPARLGDIIELTGRVVRAGRRSLGVEVELIAETPLSGERRQCTRGVFNMVAVGSLDVIGGAVPPITAPQEELQDGVLRMVELVMPGQTNHYGSLYGGDMLAAMGKAAFVVATRRSRKAVVMASSERMDFTSPIYPGEVIEISARLGRVGRSSMAVEMELRSENLMTRESRLCGRGTFVMVAVGADQHPIAVDADNG
jgi:acyl-CoA hydrolase